MTTENSTSPDTRRPFSVFQQRIKSGRRGPELVTQPPLAERHATWLELFFDLVFVFTISELTYLAEENLTLAGMAQVALLLLAVFWVWIGFAYYADQFDANDLPYRLLLVSGMFGVIILSLTIRNAFHGGANAFALSYVILRLIVIGLYTRAWFFVEEARPLVGRLLVSYILSVVLFAISIFVPEPTCYVLWIIALLVEYGGSPIAYVTTPHVPAQVSHMPERFGLFIIIVLGEAVIAVATSTQNFDWQLREIVMAVCGFIVVVCMWWLYFNRADSEVISRAVNSGRNRDLLLSYAYGYSNVLVALGSITGAASFIETIDAALRNEPVSEAVYVFASSSLVIYIVGVVINHWAAPNSLEHRQIIIRLGGAVLLLIASLFRLITDPVLTVVLAAVVLSFLAIMERPSEAEHGKSAQETN